MARTGLAQEAIDTMNAAIRAIWSSVDHWAQRRRLDRAATLAYELTADSLTMTVHDEGGWLASVPARMATRSRAWWPTGSSTRSSPMPSEVASD